MKHKSSTFTIGIDLGDRKHAVCVLDAKGEVLKQETITHSRPSLTALSRRYPGVLMAMEVGMDPYSERITAGIPGSRSDNDDHPGWDFG